MAEHGEWNRKGATLSDVTAQKEFGFSRELIVESIRAGKLEYRHGSVWANPYLRVLRSQREVYIADQMGAKHLTTRKNKAELRKVNQEIRDLETKQVALKTRKAQLEANPGY